MADYDFFVALVAGENPDELMKPYDVNLKVEPYVVYKLKDAKKLKEIYIKETEDILEHEDLLDYERKELQTNLNEIKELSDQEFFEDFTIAYDIDPYTGDAITTMNKNGRWSMYQKAKLFSVPFITKDGREVFQARKNEIDWDKMHLSNQETYKRAWEMIMEKDEPQNENEKIIYENMKNRLSYFGKFKTKENYVIYNTAFWAYAFVNDQTWTEVGDDTYKWVSDFYDNFIKPLPDNTLLTIFECKK